MSDIVLGTIIGGAIAVVGSAVVALIHGYYSLKGKREENLLREQEQSTQIRHEKNTELIRRIIEVRKRYLEPVSEHLNRMQTPVSDFRHKLLIVIVKYRHEGSEIGEQSETSENNKVRVEAAKKPEFIEKLKSVGSVLSGIESSQKRIEEESLMAGDVKLTKLLAAVVINTYYLRRDYYDKKADLKGGKKDKDFMYDFQRIVDLTSDIRVSMAHANGRIASLLGGVDAGDE